MWTYKVCPEKVQPLLIQWVHFVWHQCHLAARKSGLEWACVNNDDFTVLVSGGGTCHWVSMCTVWPLHSKWLSRVTSLHQILHEAWKFLHRNYSDNSEGCSYGQLVIGSFITTMSLLTHHVSCRVFGWNIKSPQWLSSWQPRFGILWLLAFPKTKITLEREKILDSQWDSGKKQWGGWWWLGGCVRSQGAYFELRCHCSMYNVSCIFFNKCLYFSHYIAGFLLDRPHIIKFWFSLDNTNWSEHQLNHSYNNYKN